MIEGGVRILSGRDFGVGEIFSTTGRWRKFCLMACEISKRLTKKIKRSGWQPMDVLNANDGPSHVNERKRKGFLLATLLSIDMVRLDVVAIAFHFSLDRKQVEWSMERVLADLLRRRWARLNGGPEKITREWMNSQVSQSTWNGQGAVAFPAEKLDGWMDSLAGVVNHDEVESFFIILFFGWKNKGFSWAEQTGRAVLGLLSGWNLAPDQGDCYRLWFAKLWLAILLMMLTLVIENQNPRFSLRRIKKPINKQPVRFKKKRRKEIIKIREREKKRTDP